MPFQNTILESRLFAWHKRFHPPGSLAQRALQADVIGEPHFAPGFCQLGKTFFIGLQQLDNQMDPLIDAAVQFAQFIETVDQFFDRLQDLVGIVPLFAGRKEPLCFSDSVQVVADFHHQAFAEIGLLLNSAGFGFNLVEQKKILDNNSKKDSTHPNKTDDANITTFGVINQ